MNDTHEVISAFLDDEPFDSGQLADALGDPGGRALLIDLIALRHLTQSDRISATPATRTWLSPARVLLTAAALLMAVGGGYLAGVRQGEDTTLAAPAPSRVVQAQTSWGTEPTGRTQ
jgi:hypothetical protein